MFLHDTQNLFLHSYQIVKIHPFLHYTQRKSTCFYTIARPIFLRSYSIIHGSFFVLSMLGEECQGLGLRYMLKESRYLLFKRQNDRKMRRVFAWFPLSVCHSHISVQFLLKRPDCAKTIAKS